MVSSTLGPLLNIFISGEMYDIEMTYPAPSISHPQGTNPDTYGDAVAGWGRAAPSHHCEACGAISWALRPFLWPVILSCSVRGSRINRVRISLLEKILFLQVFKSQKWLRPEATSLLPSSYKSYCGSWASTDTSGRGTTNSPIYSNV